MSEVLHNAVVEYMRDHDERDPDQIAGHVYDILPDGEIESLMLEMIAEYVRDVQRSERQKAIKSARNAKRQRAQNSGTVYKKRSAEIRAYDKLINSMVSVKGQFRKQLGACTRDEVRALNRSHIAMSDNNLDAADRYAALDKLFDTNRRAKIVGDLDHRALLRAMTVDYPVDGEERRVA